MDAPCHQVLKCVRSIVPCAITSDRCSRDSCAHWGSCSCIILAYYSCWPGKHEWAMDWRTIHESTAPAGARHGPCCAVFSGETLLLEIGACVNQPQLDEQAASVTKYQFYAAIYTPSRTSRTSHTARRQNAKFLPSGALSSTTAKLACEAWQPEICIG
jgi:hypothetical protein